MEILGFVERIDAAGVEGWAFAPAAPGAHIAIAVSLDELVIGAGDANGPRQDLRSLGYGQGDHGFRIAFELPIDPAHLDAIEIHATAPDGTSFALRRLKRPEPAPEPAAPPAATEELDPESLFDGLEAPAPEPPPSPPPAPEPAPSALLAAQAPPPDGPLKVFVIGSPRSGTSVMLLAMQKVFDLPAHGESHVMPAVSKAVFHLQQYFDRFHGQGDDLLIKHLPNDLIFGAIYDNIRKFYADTYGDGGFADKTPSDEAIYGVSVIPAIFPDARIIMTRRSGVEVVESYRKKFSAGFRDACENWVRVMNGIKRARTMSIPILEVDQFDFTNDTATVATRIAEYLGRPDRAAALALFLATSREDKLSSHDWSRRMTLADAPWSDEEKAMFRDICGPMMATFGYDMEGRPRGG